MVKHLCKQKGCGFGTSNWDSMVSHWRDMHAEQWKKIAEWLGVDEDGAAPAKKLDDEDD